MGKRVILSVSKHFLTFALVALLACKDEKIPEHILTVDKMTAILVDIHLAEGKIHELQIFGDTAKMTFAYYEKEIFAKHQIDADLYKESFEYHLHNIKTMDDIYARVVDSLNVRRQINSIE